MAADNKSMMVLDGAREVETAFTTQEAQQKFIARMMHNGVDYGTIPGTKKRSMFQPGAQKLLYYNGMGARLTITEKVQDWDKPFFHYEAQCEAFHKRTGAVLAVAHGSSNSREECFAYRWAFESQIPRGTDVKDLKSKDITTKAGKKLTLYRMRTEDQWSQANTILKRAEKRAMIAATMLACRASDSFSQEVEEENYEKHEGPDGAKDVTPKGEPGDGAISEKQLNRLHAIKKSTGVTDDALAQHLYEKYSYLFDEENKVHLTKIRWGNDYNAIIAWLEKGGKA